MPPKKYDSPEGTVMMNTKKYGSHEHPKFEYTIADYRKSSHAKDDPHFSDEMKEDLARKIQGKIDQNIPPPRNLPEGWTGLLHALLHESRFLSVELDYFSRLTHE